MIGLVPQTQWAVDNARPPSQPDQRFVPWRPDLPSRQRAGRQQRGISTPSPL